MLENEDEKLRKELARKIKKALSMLPRGGKARIAALCGKTPQAVTGWENSGKISFFQLCVISQETNISLEYFAPRLTQELSLQTNEEPEIYRIRRSNTHAFNIDENNLLSMYRKLLPSQRKKLLSEAELLTLDADQLRAEHKAIKTIE